ncbi:glycine cleavage system protein R [sulfur-oxidizing endosymbiont of Gigantopelta aegis]|uniref:glycine cleavage system protein R n=1 Tax=sulfur-oxidizing endosymbiont of Gigantopelta aegis TaxID=2794934 RepID=UPI0018DE7471|nr:ACT domain-containing protein [sulfur-oxidizing endosymbiont of Gigantopelta aegis]
MTTHTVNKSNQLVISAIGSDRPGIVNALSEIIVQNQGNIDDSRMTVLGGEFAIILLISGSEDELKNIEQLLKQQASSLALNIISKHTNDKKPEQNIPYIVEVLAMDNPGIVYKLADFFSSREINIQSMQTDRYPAPHTGTQMFAVELVITVPPTIIVNDLRDDFLDLCEDMNLDASIEAPRL